MTAILRGATLALIGFYALFLREAFQSEAFQSENLKKLICKTTSRTTFRKRHKSKKKSKK